MRFAITAAVVFALAGAAPAGTGLAQDLGQGLAGPAGAATATAVIDSFDAPGTAPMGLDWVESDGVIYHVDEARGDVYSITPDGTARRLFDVATATGHAGSRDVGNGIVYVPEGDGVLCITDYNGADRVDDPVYKFTLAGTLLDSFNVHSFCPSVTGICYDGTNFWLSSFTNQMVLKCDENLDSLAAFPHPATWPGGMDYDPATGTFYLTDFASGEIYICDSTMTVLDSFETGLPVIGMFGVSIGRTYRDRSLWASDFADTLIYEIADEYDTAVEPATWGRIKALFLP